MNPKPTHLSIVFVPLLLSSCQTQAPPTREAPTLPPPTASPPTSTDPAPSPSPVRPTTTPSQRIFAATAGASPTPCESGPLSFFPPPFDTMQGNVGPVDGARFYNEATDLNRKYVEVSAQVLEAQHLTSPDGTVDGTLILVTIEGEDGNLYEGEIFLLDKGSGVLQYLPDSYIQASGVHVGYATVPPDLFTSFPNHEGYQLPIMLAMTSSGGCSPA